MYRSLYYSYYLEKQFRIIIGDNGKSATIRQGTPRKPHIQHLLEVCSMWMYWKDYIHF